ncbi:MAG: hypothetical protein SF182_17165 [Deltaproteobacteria bacterium]|nr:hypothetical protein [Deltaproteobacteria bacterium]
MLLAGSLNSGCFRQVRSAGPAPSAAGGTATGEFTTHALPVYRLATSEVLVDSPSRLVVFQVRLEGGDSSYAFTPRDLTIALPDGTQAVIFDQARAVELLRRTTIANADFSYLQRDGHVPGGIAPYSRQPIAEMVASRLLSEGSFGAGEALQGYVVADVGTARMSLDGTVVEVTARRLPDAAPTRATFVLATAPAVGATR